MTYVLIATLCLFWGSMVGMNLAMVINIVVDERLGRIELVKIHLLAIFLAPLYGKRLIERNSRNQTKIIEERYKEIKNIYRRSP